MTPVDLPAARQDHAIVYDPARNELVMFGGDLGGTKTNETWIWSWSSPDDDDGMWELASTDGPGPRVVGSAMVFDAARGEVVLYGGAIDGSVAMGDTWLWRGRDVGWVPGPDGPGGRYGASMVYAEGFGYTLLFGGSNAQSSFYGDTWMWDGAQWIDLQVPGPSARYQAAMFFDAYRQQIILFGGDGPGEPFDDTWAFDCQTQTWTELDLAMIPPSRQLPAVAYDPCRLVGVMFGGFGGSGAYLDDVWEWNSPSGSWRPVAASGPVGRHASAMDYFPARRQPVLFGGQNGGGGSELGDMWAYAGGNPADFNGDGVINTLDVLAFLNAWATGCP